MNATPWNPIDDWIREGWDARHVAGAPDCAACVGRAEACDWPEGCAGVTHRDLAPRGPHDDTVIYVYRCDVCGARGADTE